MRRILILVAGFFLAICLASCSDTDLTSSQGTSANGHTQTPVTEAIASPASPQISLVFGVKSVLYSMSDYDAGKQNLPLNKYVSQYTNIYGYTMDQRSSNLIFSDKDLPIFILNASGGGETAIHDIVAVDPFSGKLYARMMPRDQYNDYMDAGSLYELSTDGTNNYTKLFDFEHPYGFALAPDARKIATLSDTELVVLGLPSGTTLSRISLKDFKDNWIPKISWSPDGNSILIDVATGDASVTPERPYNQTVGCYIVNILDGSMKKLSAPIFQSPRTLSHGYLTDPASYAFFPQSDRLIGMARKNAGTKNLVEFFSVAADGTGLTESPISNNDSVWEGFISPDEQYLAYPCMLNICVSNLNGGNSMVASQAPASKGGAELEQTILGWMER